MDSNQQAQQEAEAPAASDPAPQAQTLTPPSESDNNKMGLWLIIGLLIIILLVGGIYWYLNKSQTQPAQQNAGTTPVTQEENLDSEINSVSVSEVDLSPVDTDLKGL